MSPLKNKTSKCSKAFTIIELILSLALGGLILTTMTMVIGNFFSSFPLVGDYSGKATERIPQSPAYQMTPRAVAMQEQISKLLEDPATSAVYVLGGKNEQGLDTAFDASIQKNALHSTGSDTDLLDITDLQKASNLLNSSQNFRSLLVNGTGTNTFSTGTAHASDFTIFFIKNQTEVTAIIKSRQSSIANSDNDVIAYVFDVSYQDDNDSTEDSLYSYIFQIDSADYNHFSEKVGASHVWLRSLPNWSINEELGSIVIFPDPAATPSTTDQGEHNFPTYCLFLPTKL